MVPIKEEEKAVEEIVSKSEQAADRPGPSTRPDSSHPITVRFSGEIVEREQKRALVAEEVPKGSSFEIVSDEGEGIGGDDLAPSPLSYFAAGIGFCLLTQISQFSKAHKLRLESVSNEQVMRFSIQGSWLREDRQGAGLDLESHIDVRSDEPPERIRACVRNAQLACFAHQSLHPDVEVRLSVALNGEPLDLGQP